MAMTKEGQGPTEMRFLCGKQPLDFSNSNNLDESQELDMKLLNKEKKGFEGEALENKKRDRENAGGSGKKVIGSKVKDGKSQESDQETHTWIERERRKKMSDLFAGLHALLPQLSSKGDKLSIVDGAINYIKSLEHTIEKLEKQKQEMLRSVSPVGYESSLMNPPWHPYDSREAFIADHGSSNNLACAMVKSIPSNSISDSAPQQPITFQTWTSPNVVMNICGNEGQLCVCTTRKPDLLTTIAFVLEKHKIEVITANILCNGNGDGYMILAHTKRASSHEFSEATSVEEIYKEAAEEIKLLIS